MVNLNKDIRNIIRNYLLPDINILRLNKLNYLKELMFKTYDIWSKNYQ